MNVATKKRGKTTWQHSYGHTKLFPTPKKCSPNSSNQVLVKPSSVLTPHHPEHSRKDGTSGSSRLGRADFMRWKLFGKFLLPKTPLLKSNRNICRMTFFFRHTGLSLPQKDFQTCMNFQESSNIKICFRLL